jgi:hypothetical protein
MLRNEDLTTDNVLMLKKMLEDGTLETTLETEQEAEAEPEVVEPAGIVLHAFDAQTLLSLPRAKTARTKKSKSDEEQSEVGPNSAGFARASWWDLPLNDIFAERNKQTCSQRVRRAEERVLDLGQSTNPAEVDERQKTQAVLDLAADFPSFLDVGTVLGWAPETLTEKLEKIEANLVTWPSVARVNVWTRKVGELSTAFLQAGQDCDDEKGRLLVTALLPWALPWVDGELVSGYEPEPVDTDDWEAKAPDLIHQDMNDDDLVKNFVDQVLENVFKMIYKAVDLAHMPEVCRKFTILEFYIQTTPVGVGEEMGTLGYVAASSALIS